jgi:hypothetical protein
MTPQRITCVCPKCRAKYHVVATAVGHHARCRSCGTTFRVAERLGSPPTEDDILRWLREAEEQEESSLSGSWPTGEIDSNDHPVTAPDRITSGARPQTPDRAEAVPPASLPPRNAGRAMADNVGPSKTA